jgi:hypothetical protein
MRKLISLLNLALIFQCLSAQTLSPVVLASSGNYYESANVSLSWTLGEIATETYTSGNIILTQGFQQPTSVSLTGINVDVLVYLEGPFSESGMSSELNVAGAIPFDQPYNAEPWNYSGTESVTSIPNSDIVDWVLIELRDATDAASATSSTRIARQAAFLLKDGSVVGLDGSSVLQFGNSFNQQLFVIVWHRNHLGVLSANALTQNSGVYSYDFSTAITQAYNANLGYKLIGSGIYGMAGGDQNADGSVDFSDISAWKTNAGTKGYKSSDFDLNNQVNNKDKNNIWVENGSLSSQVPN